MGNRAVIALDEYHDNAMGIYLHWNGGRDSIEAFLEATRRLMADRLGDKQYGRARLIQVIGTFIGGNLSLGLGPCRELDCENWDNGVYVVDTATMTIKRREHMNGPEQRNYDCDDMASSIIAQIEAAKAAQEAA